VPKSLPELHICPPVAENKGVKEQPK
jgi:hypothetical protein